MAVRKLNESKYGVFKYTKGKSKELVKEFDTYKDAFAYASELRKYNKGSLRDGSFYGTEEIKESLKEGYSDGTVSTSEIMDAINALEELVEMMDDAGVSSIHASSSTYGLGQHFIGFPGGFIDLSDPERYAYGGDEDEEYDEEEY